MAIPLNKVGPPTGYYGRPIWSTSQLTATVQYGVDAMATYGT